MQVSDLSEVLEIENQCFRFPWAPEFFLQELQRNPQAYLFVVRLQPEEIAGTVSADFVQDGNTPARPAHSLPADQVIAGFLAVSIAGDELHVNNLAIHPSYQNLGLGRWLVDDALEFGREHGCCTAILEVRTSNHRAIRLYEAAGFSRAGILPRYYHDGESAYIFLRNIAARK